VCKSAMAVLVHQGWSVGIPNELLFLIPVGSPVDHPFARTGAAPISEATRGRLGIDRKGRGGNGGARREL